MDSEFPSNITERNVQIRTYKGKYNMKYWIICITLYYYVALDLPNQIINFHTSSCCHILLVKSLGSFLFSDFYNNIQFLLFNQQMSVEPTPFSTFTVTLFLAISKSISLKLRLWSFVYLSLFTLPSATYSFSDDEVLHNLSQANLTYLICKWHIVCFLSLYPYPVSSCRNVFPLPVLYTCCPYLTQL